MTDKVTMTALDTMHMSNVSPENLTEGDVFSVSEDEAKRLEDRGLAKRGGSKSDSVNAEAVAPSRPETREEIDAERGVKAEKAAPENKMVSVTSNKKTSAKKGK